MSDWTDPMVIVGGAQVLMALVLVWFTRSLSKSTDKYAKITERDLELKEKIGRIELIHKELDNIIGALYSNLGEDIKSPEANYFSNESILGYEDFIDNDQNKKYIKAAVFWRDIKKNLFLTTPKARKKIKDYLDIKLGIRDMSNNISGYNQDFAGIAEAVENRYKKLTDELDKLENKE